MALTTCQNYHIVNGALMQHISHHSTALRLSVTCLCADLFYVHRCKTNVRQFHCREKMYIYRRHVVNT